MKNSIPSDQWFTVAEVAQLLKVSSSEIYSLAAQNLLVCHRIGSRRGCLRIAKSDLEQFLAAARQNWTEAAGPRQKRHSTDPKSFRHIDVTRVLGSKKQSKRR